MFWLVGTVLLGVVGIVATVIAVNGRKDQTTNTAPVALMVAIGCLVLWIILSFATSIYTVGQRQAGIQYNFAGTIVGKKGTGWGLKAPWTRLETANVGVLRENFALDSSNSAVSSDQQAIYADLALNYDVLPQDILHLYRTVGPNWKAILLDSRVLQDFKQVTSTFTAEQITTQRQQLRDQTKFLLKKELGKYGIGVVDFFVTNLSYTPSYQSSINAKNIQVQQALQAQAKVAQSQAEAEQSVATARGAATATVLKAKADAQALRLQGAAIRANPEVLRLQAINKLNPNAQVIICTGTTCPSFLPQATGTTVGK